MNIQMMKLFTYIKISFVCTFTRYVMGLLTKLLFLIILYKSINCQLNCNKIDNYVYKFNLLRHCQRSNKTVIALGKYLSLEECSKFAQNARGLAFNYNPIGRGDVNLFIKKSNIITGKGQKVWAFSIIQNLLRSDCEKRSIIQNCKVR